ncbi:hypothetical protein [Escherichia coli]|uniref:hypothetical protein n=1 Tax=Escherichia coli TaxID=562 RepID=UPI00186633C7|nr:hypothetical protein [Escherichia coli]
MEGRWKERLKSPGYCVPAQKMGMTPEQIKQATGLSDDELKKSFTDENLTARQNTGPLPAGAEKTV